VSVMSHYHGVPAVERWNAPLVDPAILEDLHLPVQSVPGGTTYGH
jgi:hypothetical protein